MPTDIINDPNEQKNTNAQGTSASTTTVAAPLGSGPNATTPGAGQPVQTTDGGGGAAGVSGRGAASSQATSSATPSQTATAPKTGTGFVNLQNILQANRQNTLGQQIGSGIQQKAEGVKSDIQQIGQNVAQQMQQGTLGSAGDQATAGNIISNIMSYQAPTTSDTTTTPSTATPAPAAGLSQTDINKMTQLMSGQYSGPSATDISNLYTPVQSNALVAQQLARNINTPGGLQALTQRFASPGINYTPGESALDALLLGQTGASNLAKAKQSTLGLGSQLQNILQGTTAQIGAAQQASSDFSNQLKSQIAASQSDILKDVQSKYEAGRIADKATSESYKTLEDLLGQQQGTTPVSVPSSGAVNQKPTSDQPKYADQIAGLVKQNLISQEDANTLSGLFNKGFVNPKDAANVAYQKAITNPDDTYSLKPGWVKIPQADGTTKYGFNPKKIPLPGGAKGFRTVYENVSLNPKDAEITNKDAVEQGLIKQQYTGLDKTDLGDISTLLKNELSLTGPTGYSIPLTDTTTQATPAQMAGFIDPTTAAKLNALAQISGQPSSPLTAGIVKPYQASSMKFDIKDLMDRIAAAEGRL